MIRVAIAAALIATPALAAERSFNVGAFDRLASAGSPEVIVTTGHAVSVRATGDAADLDTLDIRVEGGTLKIDRKKQGWGWSSWKDRGPVRIMVTVPMLRSVEAAGSGSVSVDRIKTADFSGKLAGSGALRLASIDAGSAAFESAGSGSITAAGRCRAGSAKIAGSGNLKLADLKCETMSASIAGSGQIDAYATRTANLATVGSGDISLTGGARCTVSTAGSGKARCA